MRGVFPIILTIVLFVQCSKEPVQDAAPSLIGNWLHNKDNVSAQKIEINSDGSGVIRTLENGVLKGSTKERDWYIYDNELHFGKAAFNGQFFPIDQYPEISSSMIINATDTILPGDRYMILDEDYYKEVE